MKNQKYTTIFILIGRNKRQYGYFFYQKQHKWLTYMNQSGNNKMIIYTDKVHPVPEPRILSTPKSETILNLNSKGVWSLYYIC